MKLIKTESGWIAVGDENKNTTFFDGHINIDILAGTPDTLKLKFSPEVAAVLGVWDAEELSQEWSKFIDESIENNPYDIGFRDGNGVGFYEGFEKRAELSAKFEFTEADIEKAYVQGWFDKTSQKFKHLELPRLIQSLREYEVETFEKTEDTLIILKLK